MEHNHKIAALIVTHKNTNNLIQLLSALGRSQLITRIIIVNNAPADQLVRQISQIPRVSIIQSKKNIGFASAINLAVEKILSNENVLILNPDIVINSSIIEKLYDTLDSKSDIAAVAPRLNYPNGIRQESWRRFPTLLGILWRWSRLGKIWQPHWYKKILGTQWQKAKNPVEIDWALGACLLINRIAFADVGEFDERFFLYYEDIDWCLRAHKKGWRILGVPAAMATHYYAAASRNALINRLTLVHAQSIAKYFWKHRWQSVRNLYTRSVDIVCATIGFIILFPLLLWISIVIVVESGWPPLFVQKRIGKNGQSFSMFKFRTMTKNAPKLRQKLSAKNEAQGLLFKIANDPRMTRYGHILSGSGLDELPQLLNVVLGQMSLIGPRPLPAGDVAPAVIQNHNPISRLWRQRLLIRPGITGFWQAFQRDLLSTKKMLRDDAAYVEHWNPLLDFKIILATIKRKINDTRS